MLRNELKDIRDYLIRQENQLARLHANIYKRREEARDIRLSLPTPEKLDAFGATKNALKKLESKKKKALCSIYRLNEKIDHNIQTYTKNTPPSRIMNYYGLFFVVFLICIGLWALYLFYPRLTT